MKVDLNKQALISLVKGATPPYEVFGNELIKAVGSYQGGFYDRWVWDERALSSLTEEELYYIYEICTQDKYKKEVTYIDISDGVWPFISKEDGAAIAASFRKIRKKLSAEMIQSLKSKK
jgi:hypothetical protein